MSASSSRTRPACQVEYLLSHPLDPPPRRVLTSCLKCGCKTNFNRATDHRRNVGWCLPCYRDFYPIRERGTHNSTYPTNPNNYTIREQRDRPQIDIADDYDLGLNRADDGPNYDNWEHGRSYRSVI